MENQIIDNMERTDRNRYLLFIGTIWCYNIVVQYVRGAIMWLVETPERSHVVINTGIVILLLLALKYILSKIKTSDILLVLGIMAVYYISHFLFPENSTYFTEDHISFLLTVLPMFFIGVTLRLSKNEVEGLYKLLYSLSMLTVVLFSLYVLFINTDKSDTYRDGDMSAAYNVLPHICMVFSSVIKKPKLLNTAIFVLGVFVLFSMGNRGTIVCLAAYVLLMLIFVTGVNKPALTVIIFLMGYVLLFVMGLYEKAVLVLYNFADSFGLSTRFFDKLIAGEITDDSSRSVIQQRIMEILGEHPVVGLGIYGDRIAGGNHYAHNFFVEVLAQFGVIIGAVLIGIVLYLIIKSFKKLIKTKRTDIMSIFFVCICSGFLKLFLSGSYLMEPYFFLLVGLSINLIRNESALYSEEVIVNEDSAHQLSR